MSVVVINSYLYYYSMGETIYNISVRVRVAGLRAGLSG